MPDVDLLSDGKFDPTQAMDLALLVDLEARWENLRVTASPSMEGQPGLQMLAAKQKAYDAFRSKLAAYNKRYRTTHLPELLLNTPARLGLWCRAMRDLYTQVAHVPQAPFPANLMEKAYRWADRVAEKRGKCRISRSNPSSTLQAAILDLEALIQWCADLATVAPAA
ncbi:MAG TPA: hypothetical protein VN688_12220 [Gemmataceae bacterium]|nr:hypothetical protein [Gemmataceae bacterium]